MVWRPTNHTVAQTTNYLYKIWVGCWEIVNHIISLRYYNILVDMDFNLRTSLHIAPEPLFLLYRMKSISLRASQDFEVCRSVYEFSPYVCDTRTWWHVGVTVRDIRGKACWLIAGITRRAVVSVYKTLIAPGVMAGSSYYPPALEGHFRHRNNFFHLTVGHLHIKWRVKLTRFTPLRERSAQVFIEFRSKARRILSSSQRKPVLCY